MSSGGGGTTNTIQNSDPWSGQQWYLANGFNMANNLLGSPGPGYYQGNTVAPFNPTQQAAMDLTTQRALNGSPVMNAANQQLTNTENGSMLNSGNPYLSGQMNNVAMSLVPQMQSIFAGGNRYGSGANQNAVDSALANADSSMAYQNYVDERKNQMQGLFSAPTLANQDYVDANALAGVGAQQQQQQQQNINADISKWNYNQNLPMDKLSQYMNIIRGNYGSTTNTQTPYFSNPLASQIGGTVAGGTTGYAIGASMGSSGGPWGAAIGALAGYLMSQ